MSDAPPPHPALDASREASRKTSPHAACHVLAPDLPEALDDDTFPWAAFPEPVRSWLQDTATATGFGPDPVAYPFLAIAGAVIGVTHRLRVAPGWIERPILWVALVGEVGVGKTPAIAAVRRPIDILQQRAWDEFEADLRRPAARPLGPGEPAPVDHVVTESVNVETLVAELSYSYGLVIVRDELIGLVHAMEGARGRRGDARQKFLSLWSATPLHSARAVPNPIIVSTPVVGILGGVQPHVYARLRSRDGDGFLERFLPVTLAGASRYWREPGLTGEATLEATPEAALDAAAISVADRFAAIRATAAGSPDVGWTIDRDPAARAVWTAWYNDNVDRLHAVPELTAGFYRKLPAHTARIALVLHVLREPDDAHQHALGPDVMENATRLAERLRVHIHRVIPHLGTGPADVAPRPRPSLPQRVHRLLAETDAPDGWLSRTEIAQRLHRPDRDELTAALASLVSDRIADARAVTRPGSRKPTRQWRLARRN